MKCGRRHLSFKYNYFYFYYITCYVFFVFCINYYVKSRRRRRRRRRHLQQYFFLFFFSKWLTYYYACNIYDHLNHIHIEYRECKKIVTQQKVVAHIIYYVCILFVSCSTTTVMAPAAYSCIRVIYEYII
jgi:hypothetical protein